MKEMLYDERNGLWKRLVGDYYLLCLTLSEREQPIWVWGMRHRDYLRAHKQAVYAELLLTGKLNSYLANIDRQAQEMFLRLVEQMAEMQGVTEQLKTDDMMAWVGRMNNIQAVAREVVDQIIIYA